MPAPTRHFPYARTFRALAALCALLALAGCATAGNGAAAGSKEPTVSASLGVGAPGTGVEGLYKQIPAGKAFSEGGVTRYTFREEWRRALAQAQKWSEDAYLVRATGDSVDASGVAAVWRLDFVDSTARVAALSLTIDSSGRVTGSTEATGSAVGSALPKHAGRIPPNIMDSDRVAKFGRQALGLGAAPGATDPRLDLAFSSSDGTGPFWTFSALDPKTGKRAAVAFDATTGEAKLQK